MLGLMQDWPLLCHRVIDHAAIQHGNREVVTRSIEGPIHRTNYRDVRKRALRVAKRLEKEGVRSEERRVGKECRWRWGGEHEKRERGVWEDVGERRVHVVENRGEK